MCDIFLWFFWWIITFRYFVVLNFVTLYKASLLQKCKIRTLKMKLINYVTFTCLTCCYNHGRNMFCDVNVFDVIRTFTNKRWNDDKQVIARFLVKYGHVLLVQEFLLLFFCYYNSAENLWTRKILSILYSVPSYN